MKVNSKSLGPLTVATFTAAIVAAQVLAQIGAFTLPALLPFYISHWSLTATQAGWLIGAFFAAYVAAVPILVSLTDRVPGRRVYLVGASLTALAHLGFAFVADGFWSALAFRAIAGIGWAGCYMPGLKVIADQLDGDAQSRAVTWHAAGVGIAGAMSFIVAGLMDGLAGPSAAFLFGAVAAGMAFFIAGLAMPRNLPVRESNPASGALLDFRPVLRNRAAMGWIIGYTVHTWELAALRAWAVTFLTVVIARQGAPDWLPGPQVIFTVAGLCGIAVSIFGNETAQRFGRARVVTSAILVAATLALATGLSALVAAPLAALCVIAWNAAIYLDSSALTAGTVQASEKGRRGATMGLHSMCGYAGGFIGPIGVGLVLDAIGPENALAWLAAFGHLGIVTVAGLSVLRALRRAA